MPMGNCPTCQIVFDELSESTKGQFAILSKSNSNISRLSFELRLRSDKLQTRARELGEASRHARASAIQRERLSRTQCRFGSAKSGCRVEHAGKLSQVLRVESFPPITQWGPVTALEYEPCPDRRRSGGKLEEVWRQRVSDARKFRHLVAHRTGEQDDNFLRCSESRTFPRIAERGEFGDWR